MIKKEYDYQQLKYGVNTLHITSQSEDIFKVEIHHKNIEKIINIGIVKAKDDSELNKKVYDLLNLYFS